MIMRKFFKLLQRAYRHYTHEDINKWKELMAHCGEGSVIHFPAIISVNKGLSIGDNTTILSNSRIQNYNTNTRSNTPPWYS